MGRVVNFTPRPLYPRERTPSIHWVGVCWAPGLVWTWRGKNFQLLPGIKPQPSSPYPSQ